MVGNELFILSQLLQDEHPILPGFALGSDLWREFVRQIDTWHWHDNLKHDDRSLRELARQSRQAILHQPIPEAWQPIIARGIQQLNSSSLCLQLFLVTPQLKQLDLNSLWRSHICDNTLQAVNRAIELVWSELFSAASLVCLHELCLSWEINLAVLVRPLKSADASGIVTLGNNSLQVEATWGLEQSLLQGDVEPDLYQVRDWHEVVERSLGRKNYGYRLPTSDRSTRLLESYLPADDLSDSYVLDAAAIVKLLELVRPILQQQPHIKSVVWHGIKTGAGNAFNFQIIQLKERQIGRGTSSLPFKTIDEVGSLPPLLSGIAASPGTVRGKLVVIPNLEHHTLAIPVGVILVTKAIEPQHVPLVKQVGGIITEIGGKNSHAAIVARELHIPAIANAANATQTLQNNELVLLDGDRGQIYPTRESHKTSSVRQGIFTPTYPIATKLMVNLSQPETIASASSLPVDGVGLLRSELMLADLLADRTLAKWQESWQQQFLAALQDRLGRFADAFAPRPVFYRSLDLYHRDAANSALGERGTYRYTMDPTLFDLEMKTLKQIIESGDRNINLILPFVRSVAEFQFCHRRLEQIDLTTKANFQVWIMAEVPSLIMRLPEYIRAGIQGIAIGTNDLTQLLLGVDREQTQFSASGLNANHPAMRQAIAQLIATAHNHNIECCICGQAPVEHPELINALIQWGVDAISVEPDAVPITYRAIARAEKKLLLNEVRNEGDY